ncbi:unnamed protein product [Amoebophrya sp. A25]|nr:unnamed protein product [Amoebophrya sp. A25]|eukprot:GSA25T00021029001.1
MKGLLRAAAAGRTGAPKKRVVASSSETESSTTKTAETAGASCIEMGTTTTTNGGSTITPLLTSIALDLPTPSSSSTSSSALPSNQSRPFPDVTVVRRVISPEDDVELAKFLRGEKREWSWTQLRGRRVMKLGGDVTSRGLEEIEPLPPVLHRIARRIAERFFVDEDVGGEECVTDGNDVKTRQLGGLSSDQQEHGRNKIMMKKIPNHVLVNDYQPGDGIMHHEDGPLYHPVVAILSLQSCVRFEFVRKEETTSTSDEVSQNSEIERTDEDASLRRKKNRLLEIDSLDAYHAKSTRTKKPENSDSSLVSIPLPARSLLVFRGKAYTDWKHGIAFTRFDNISDQEYKEHVLLEGDGRDEDGDSPLKTDELGESEYFREQNVMKRGTRISLTFRYVPPAKIDEVEG